MALKERSYEEIQKDETAYIALNRLIDSANEVVEENQVYTAGEGFKKNRSFRSQCMQRLIKEMYKEYGTKCKDFPEVRFQIYPDSNCLLVVTDGKKRSTRFEEY